MTLGDDEFERTIEDGLLPKDVFLNDPFSEVEEEEEQEEEDEEIMFVEWLV